MPHALESIIIRAKLMAIDEADEQSRSAGYCKFQRPTQRPTSYTLPSANPLILGDELLGKCQRMAQSWVVRHDDGRELFRGTRREADGWMERQIAQYSRTDGRYGHAEDCVALIQL